MQCLCFLVAVLVNWLVMGAVLILLAQLRLMIILAQLKSNHIVNAQNYLLASSPALLGFLWAVTDADVDQWTVLFLQHWLSGKKDGQSELLQVCKLPMLTKYYAAFLRDFDALFLFLHILLYLLSPQHLS